MSRITDVRFRAAPREEANHLLLGCEQKDEYPITNFTFFGYTFRPRKIKDI